MTNTAAWPTRIATTAFVAHPDYLDRAQKLYVERLNQIPPEQARIHFVSEYPKSESDEHDLWNLRCTAVYEGLRLELPDPETLELFSVHCVISINPDFEDEVHEKLFFCDHSEPDPFPGSQYGVNLDPFIPGRDWAGRSPDDKFRHEVLLEQGEEEETPPLVATQWLVTLHLMSSLREAAQLAAEYSRLIDVVHAVRDLDLLASSPHSRAGRG